MKILMIAPEPFFEPRGTPFSEYFRIKALCKMGHTIDLVTYPIGRDKEIEGLKIIRSLKPPFIKSVKTGPSVSKIFLDFFLFFKAWAQALRGRKKYDLIYTHEEASIMGVFFSKLTKIPHLYDMHSSLVQQMNNFQFTKSKIIIGFFKWMEKKALRSATSIIVICQALYDYASTITDQKKLTIIENFIDDTPPPDQLDKKKLSRIKKEIGSGLKTIVTYTGTLEKYQGIPLLLESMALLPQNYRLVLIGGKPAQVEDVKRQVEIDGLTDRVSVLGSKEPEEIPYYLFASDILVSPRILGTNIPLKIYSYLKSGLPVVATNLYTHTQSINSEISILKEPNPKDFAAGILEASSEKGKKITNNAEIFCKKNYNGERYMELVNEALEKVRKNKQSDL